jgi:hypothetical protein
MPDTPPNKFSNYLDTSLYSGAGAVQTALNSAWSAYFTAYGAYPNVWVTVGTVVYYGGYSS